MIKLTIKLTQDLAKDCQYVDGRIDAYDMVKKALFLLTREQWQLTSNWLGIKGKQIVSVPLELVDFLYKCDHIPLREFTDREVSILIPEDYFQPNLQQELPIYSSPNLSTR